MILATRTHLGEAVGARCLEDSRKSSLSAKGIPSTVEPPQTPRSLGHCFETLAKQQSF